MATLTQAERRAATPLWPDETSDAGDVTALGIALTKESGIATTEDLRNFLYLEHTDDDNLLQLLINSAYEQVEQYTGRIIRVRPRQAVWTRRGRCLPAAVGLPEGIAGYTPGIAVNAEHPPANRFVLGMLEDDLTAHAFVADDVVFAPGLVGIGVRIMPSEDWPLELDHEGAFLTATYIPRTLVDTDARVAVIIKQTVLMLAGGGYENRESETVAQRVTLNPAVERMLRPLQRLHSYRSAI